jgi:ADP-ribose pyrophosphatase
MKETSCGYLIQDHRWLMLYRNKKQNDLNAGKWIGIGGKLEPGESMLQCMSREIKEETGLNAEQLELRGIVSFEYEDAEPEKIYVYTIERFSGEMKECDEGTLQWVDESDILSLDLWEGDKIFLKRLLQGDHHTFWYVLSYDKNGTFIKSVEKEITNK